jgi:hypothetical protein
MIWSHAALKYLTEHMNKSNKTKPFKLIPHNIDIFAKVRWLMTCDWCWAPPQAKCAYIFIVMDWWLAQASNLVLHALCWRKSCMHLNIYSSMGRKVTKIITQVMRLEIADDRWLIWHVVGADTSTSKTWISLCCDGLMAGSGLKSMHKGKGYIVPSYKLPYWQGAYLHKC